MRPAAVARADDKRRSDTRTGAFVPTTHVHAAASKDSVQHDHVLQRGMSNMCHAKMARQSVQTEKAEMGVAKNFRRTKSAPSNIVHERVWGMPGAK